MQFSQPNAPAGQPATQQHQQNLQRLLAMGVFSAIPGATALPGAGMALPAGFQQAQASQLQLQAALAQNPALQAQFAQQLQQQAILAQRASLAQPGAQLPGTLPTAAAVTAAPSLAAAAAAAAAAASKVATVTATATQNAKLAVPHATNRAASVAAAGKPTTAAAKAAAAAASAVAAVTGAHTGVRQAEAAPAKKAGNNGLKKRKAGDARLLDKVNQLIPESALFTAIQDAERRADMLISRKKMELQEMYTSFRRGPPGTPHVGGALRKKLRVYLFNEHFNQPPRQQQQGAAAPAQPSSVTSEPPSWALHIQGRLVDAGEAPSSVPPQGPFQPRHHFTHYIRKLQVQLDPLQYPGAEGRVGWEKSRHDREHRDSFEIRRRGSGSIAATISLELDYQPQQYILSPPLSAMLGMTGLHSLPFIMQLLWGYIKQHGLYQSSHAPLVVRCDDKMQAAFGGVESLPLTELQETVRRSCKAPEPATIQVVIRTDGPSPTHPDCYDFDFEVPLGHDLPAFASKTSVDQKLQESEQSLGTILQKLQEHKRRRTFFMAFAQNPVDFINALIATQARELRIAASKEGETLEVLAAGDVFKEKWVEDAVMRFLHRRMAAGVH